MRLGPTGVCLGSLADGSEATGTFQAGVLPQIRAHLPGLGAAWTPEAQCPELCDGLSWEEKCQRGKI